MTAPRIAPCERPRVDATVLICTYNRAAHLDSTLASLARQRVEPGLSWDVVVVDNNSTDPTKEVVDAHAAAFPVPLTYLFEPVQGKSNALNTGIRAAAARIIVFTDDDVQVPESWLEAAVRPLLAREDIDYTGGPVDPLWEIPAPRWLDVQGNLGGTVAVKDHGPAAFVFEDEKKTPLGVNMAVRRSLIERIGGFRPDLGRSGRSLLGQEQAEFFYRSRAAGARGLYLPGMRLRHLVPAARLTASYFLRWWYWKGVSHARLHGIHGTTELGLDLARVPHIGRVPRFVFGTAARSARAMMTSFVRLDVRRAVAEACMLAYSFGYVREARRTARRTQQGSTPPRLEPTASNSTTFL